MTDPGLVDVGAREEFPEGAVTAATVHGLDLVILCWSGTLHAVQAICPHMGGPLCRGRLGPRLDGPVIGAMSSVADDPVLACPWHGWEFSAGTGAAIAGGRYRLRTFGVTVRAGRVLVDVSRLEGPQRATKVPQTG